MTDTLLTNDDLTDTTDFRKELFGEGKKFDRTKYSSTEEWEAAVAKGKVLADQTLDLRTKQYDTLKSDYLRLKDDYESRAKLEELLTQIDKQQLTSSTNTKANEEEKQPALDINEYKKIARSEYQEQKQLEQETANFNLIKSRLQERHGDNYSQVLREQISTLGLTQEEVDNLARRHPNVLIKTLGLDQKQATEPFQSPLQTSRRSDSFAPTAPKQRTWAYYQELKKRDPKEYLTPKIQTQMQKDAIALGEAFTDGDFHN